MPKPCVTHALPHLGFVSMRSPILASTATLLASDVGSAGLGWSISGTFW